MASPFNDFVCWLAQFVFNFNYFLFHAHCD
jgi:hypothetical protein